MITSYMVLFLAVTFFSVSLICPAHASADNISDYEPWGVAVNAVANIAYVTDPPMSLLFMINVFLTSRDFITSALDRGRSITAVRQGWNQLHESRSMCVTCEIRA